VGSEEGNPLVLSRIRWRFKVTTMERSDAFILPRTCETCRVSRRNTE
jgi:hypothetical protein